MTHTALLDLTDRAAAPGATDTPLDQTAYTPAVRIAYRQRVSLGRIGTLLASDASRYVTGHELLVDDAPASNGSVGHARS